MTVSDSLKTLSEELAQHADSVGLTALSEHIHQDAARRLTDQRVRVVVLGEIKHGKSSLINALLGGEPKLPVGVTPTTSAVATVTGPSKAGATGFFEVLPTGDERKLEADAFRDRAMGRVEAEGRLLVRTVEMSRLADSIELLDTPGLNDIAKLRSAVSRGELPRADALILVLDATQALSRTELKVIRDAIAAVGGLNRSGATLDLVINRIDLVSADERDKVVEHCKSQLAEILPGDAMVFTTNAKGALEEGHDPDALGVKEVRRLRGRIAELAQRGDEILPARMRSSLLRYARLVGYNAAIAARALTLEADELEEEVKAVKAALADSELDLGELRSTIESRRDEIISASRSRVAEFCDQLTGDSLALLKKADQKTITRTLPGAIKDAVIDFTEREAGAIRVELEQVTHDVLKTHGDQARRRLFEATLRLGFQAPSVYIDPPSVGIEVGLLVLGIAGTAVMYFGSTVTGLVMTIASPLATMALREKSVRQARERAKSAIPSAVAEARETLGGVTESIVAAHASALDEHITAANQALGSQLLAVLARAQTALSSDGDGAKRAAEQSRLHQVELSLAGIVRQLETLEIGPALRIEDFEPPPVVH